MDETRRAHLNALRHGDVASQVVLLGERLRQDALPRSRVALAAQLGDGASECVLGLPAAGRSFEALQNVMAANGAGEVKARALIAMARSRVAEWHREQDTLVCAATQCSIQYDQQTSRVTFNPALGLCTLLERPYYKDYSTHYVLRTEAGASHAIRTWDRAGDDADWVELCATVGVLDTRALTGLSVRRATWIKSTDDLTITTDADGWVSFAWLSDGTPAGFISTGGGDETIALDGLPGPDTPSKVLWAAQKCTLCPCRLHAAVCTCLDSFASSWRSRWGALTAACLAAAELVPPDEQLLERWPWPYSTLDGTRDLPPAELAAVVTELTLWALELGDPVADDVARLERSA